MTWGFPRGSVVKNLPAHAKDTDLVPDPGRPHMPWDPATKPEHRSYWGGALGPWSRTAEPAGPGAPALYREAPQREAQRRSQRMRPALQPRRVSQLGTIPHSKEDSRSQK